MWQVWFFFSPLNKSQESSTARTKAADSQRNVVQARKINLLAPNNSSDHSRNINSILESCLIENRNLLFLKHVGRKAEKSSWNDPPSLSSAPATPSSTAPTNTKLLAASICCDPASLVHSRGGGRFRSPPIWNSVVGSSWWLRLWLPQRRLLFNLSDSFHGIPCAVGNESAKRAGAKRAPVKAWAGSGG